MILKKPSHLELFNLYPDNKPSKVTMDNNGVKMLKALALGCYGVFLD